MSHRLFAWLIIPILVLAFGSELKAARNKESFDKLSRQILETLQSFYPVQATSQGIHSYDYRLADFSSGAVKRMKGDLADYTKQLYKYRNYKFSLDDRVNFQLIRSNVEIALLDLREIKWYRKCPQIYIDEAVNGIYFLILSQHAPLSEKLPSIIARMKEVPALFKTATRNLKKPPEEYIDLASESLESAQRFYYEVAGELMGQFPDRADEILRVTTKAREAMAEFAVHLAEMEPGPEKSFAIGRENFEYRLAHEHFLNITADSLLEIGESLLAEAQKAYHSYQEYVENNHQNGRDSVFIPASFNRQDLLDYYQWEVDQAKVFLTTHNILTVPEDIAPVRVEQTPDFLRSMIAGIAYQPSGPFDENQTGIFYVRPIPEDLDPAQLAARYRYVNRRGFKGSVVHEAFPGHHLQMQLAGRNPSPVRKWQSNVFFIEGWALYCEEMMYRAGLYGPEDPAMWLAILGGIRYRAARIVADVKLHTGQFSSKECADWMIEVLDADTESAKDYHRRMVRKYTLTPTVWMSYLMGKIEIERLRDDVKARDGDAFNERKFYDRLLAQGSIPPALIRELFGF
ncbi:MAG: DUF885 domain-containing protein [candidate division Zixibacteria bacterium]|nr:DUF885 domain-containing protein [candidate division Zixibacteria bacterium]